MTGIDLIIFDCDGVLVDSEIIASEVEAALLTEAGYPISIEEMSERFSGMVPLNYANREINLTASIGLVSWLDQEQSAAGLLDDAELAMFRAKKAGGNRVEPFRPAFRTSGSDRLQLEADLKRAIERKELSLVYQPIVRLSDAEIAGFEALMNAPLLEDNDLVCGFGGQDR